MNKIYFILHPFTVEGHVVVVFFPVLILFIDGFILSNY